MRELPYAGEDLHGGRRPPGPQLPHAARANLPDAEGLLASLITERGQPGIARATALPLLPRYVGPGSISAYQAGWRDPDPLVRKAAEIESNSARYGYVYAVALNATGRPDRAIEVLAGVLENNPKDRDVLIALITINRDRGMPKRALQYAEKLITAYPQHQMAHRLIMELQKQR